MLWFVQQLVHDLDAVNCSIANFFDWIGIHSRMIHVPNLLVRIGYVMDVVANHFQPLAMVDDAYHIWKMDDFILAHIP